MGSIPAFEGGTIARQFAAPPAASWRPQEMSDIKVPPFEQPIQEAAAPAAQTQARPAGPVMDRLPPFKVILHNDKQNDMLYVVETICDLTPLNPHTATTAMLEAHNTGAALLLVTHRERAELYIEQFKSKKLSVSMEPAE